MHKEMTAGALVKTEPSYDEELVAMPAFFKHFHRHNSDGIMMNTTPSSSGSSSPCHHHVSGSSSPCQHVSSDESVVSSRNNSDAAEKTLYSCNECDKRFHSKWSLKRHMMSHSGEKPHTCDVCAKSFASKWQLDLHYRTHTGEKPYSCDICSKRFTTKSHMSRHRRIHGNTKAKSADAALSTAPAKYTEAAKCTDSLSELSIQSSPLRDDQCEPDQTNDEPLDLSMRTLSLKRTRRELPALIPKKKFLTHTKSYQGEHSCETCHKQFSNMSKLKLHQRIAHPQVLYVYGLTHVVYL